MNTLFRAEMLKQRTTWTALGLFATMLGLVLLAVVLHGLLPAHDLVREDVQLMVLGRGAFLGVLFAALLGAMSITSEFRHGTIRPTFLVAPWRARVVLAKVGVSILIGAGFGLGAGAVAATVGTAALKIREVPFQLDGGNYSSLVVGAAGAAALWGAIGVAVGALVRNQVPALIGICTWVLFVEGLLVGDLVGLGEPGRFLPGMAAAAISGQDPGKLLEPVGALVLLVAYATALTIAGAIAISRRDVS